MPIPFLLMGAAGIAALTGIGTGARAIHKNNEAKGVNQRAQAMVDSAKNTATRAKNKSRKTLENLGETKLVVLDTTMKSFVNTFEKIHSIEFVESTELGELNKYHIDKQQLGEMKDMGNIATSVLSGIVGGAGAGALAAFGAYGATMTFATASTGTAIASLSGVAATNATLAFLGGGSLAAGGLGMAGGTMVLGGVVAGPALCILGIVMNASASKNLDNAYANLAEAEKATESLKVVTTLCKSIAQRADMFINLLNGLNTGFSKLTEKLICITAEKGYNYQDYSEDEQNVVVAAMAMAKTVKQVLDTPILTESGAVTQVSQQVYEKISAQYQNDPSVIVANSSTGTAKRKKKGSVDYAVALNVTLRFFAQCDGEISEAEQALFDQYITALNNDYKFTPEEQQQLDAVQITDFTSFDQIVVLLNRVTTKELQQIKEQVRKLLLVTDGIGEVEKKEYSKFVRYEATRIK